MTTRADRWVGFRDQQRNDIADAVIAAVSNADGEPVNVTEVVDIAGISRKTFYKYFDTLSAAMVYAHSRVQRQLTEHAETSVQEASNGRERYLGMLSDIAIVAGRHPELIRFSNYFDYTFRGKGLTHAERGQQGSHADAETIAQAFRDGQADGSIRPDVDPATHIFASGNSVIGLVQRFQVVGRSDGQEFLRDAIDLLVDVWRHHLAPPS